MKILIFLVFILSVFQTSFGVISGYQPLSPIPGLTDTNEVSFATSGSTSGSGLSDRISGLYKWGVALTSGLAVLVIMWGGVGYMTSAGGSGIEEAKGRISAALMGLMLALGSYIILKTINQDLLETTFELEPLTVVSTTNTSGTTVINSSSGIYTINADGTISYNGQSTGYKVDSNGNIVDSSGNPAGYINDTPLNVTNFTGSLSSEPSTNAPDTTVGAANSTLASSLAQSATDAYGQNLGQGTSQRVACASTTCSILNNSGIDYGNITGTATLATTLSNDSRFQVTALDPGVQITSSMLQHGDIVNTASSGGVTGHVGVVNTNGLIANNDSDTGLVKESSVSQWNSGVVSRGLTTYIYRAK